MFFKEKRVFITGTDTDVGKTFVSVKLLNMTREKGLNPGYFKPVATGGVFRNGNLVSEDVLTVKEQALIADDCNFINPVLYKLAAAPRIAAETEAEVIDMLKIDNAYEALCRKYESFIVEGIGGIYVPVTEEISVIDLIKKWELPVILVSKAVLGNINQTVLSLKALQNEGVNIIGVVVSYVTEELPGIAIEKSFIVIEEMSKVPILAKFPYEGESK